MATVAEALAIALAHHRAGRIAEAQEIYRRILAVEPDQPDALNLLGVIAYRSGQHEAAVGLIGRAIALRPLDPALHHNLGNALQSQAKSPAAVACYRRALELAPDYAEAHNGLAIALKDLGQSDEAIVCCRRALALRPDYAAAHNSLGNALAERGRLAEAAACFRRAIELQPELGAAHANLGASLKDLGQLDEALASFRRALELNPDDTSAHSKLLSTLYFCPDYDPQAILDEHRRWNGQHAAPLAGSIRAHGNDRSPERRLRVGYVSPDFCFHPVGRFLLPLLEAHDRRRFEIFGYASVRNSDATTRECREHCDAWRDVRGHSDEQLAETIRQDGIDILVDLTMHMAGSRLLVFARRPAPVQVTYLAYCGTTGLETIDYRLTDPHLDPPGAPWVRYSEESVCFGPTYWCYRAPAEAGPVGPLPAAATGQATFGCLNNFCKVTPTTIAAWGRLLRAAPGARLLLHAPQGSHRQQVLAALARHEVSPHRLQFADVVQPAEYFRTYQQIDVALDPFPYGGGTTTCDALWMGVPVVSLAGGTAVGRGGLSILSNIGLPELVARDVDHYVAIAVELAGDLPRLARLRASLRDRLERSPLMDAPRFAGNVEAAYREMWRRWCGK